MCAWPSSNVITLSKSSCTSISRVSESTSSGGDIGLGGDTVMLLLRPTTDRGGSGDTVETLEILDDSSRRGYGCCG